MPLERMNSSLAGSFGSFVFQRISAKNSRRRDPRRRGRLTGVPSPPPWSCADSGRGADGDLPEVIDSGHGWFSSVFRGHVPRKGMIA